MRWWLHDGDTVVEIATDTRAPEGDVRALSDRELESLLSRTGGDLWGMSTLRRMYVEAVAAGGSASVSDLVVTGELIEAAHSGRLHAWAAQVERVRREPRPDRRQGEALTELVDLASKRAAPPAPIAPPPSAAVLHQVEILQRAAASGVPFCEECECAEGLG
ncbi:MAG: hypothetical protein IAG13_01815 [Deltaproteobacteria bacterium]|nr:hypothetical protein [Nannocystaceae bacterium]